MKNVYFVGAPTTDKGLEDFAYIAAKYKNAKFYWFTFNINERLRNKYKNITFISGMDDDKLRKYIKGKMDIFVSCSHAEGFCLPIAEAMLLEKPVLSYGLEEVKSVYSNMIEYIDCYDKNEFISKLQFLIKSKKTYNKCKKAKKYIEDNYMPNIVSSRLLKYIL